MRCAVVRFCKTAGSSLPFGARVVSAAPPAEPVTPALIDAAKKEGKVTYYTAMDLSVAEPMAKAFEARYPGIKVAVERSGAERVFNRIGQEMGEQDLPRRRGEQLRRRALHLLEARGLAGAVRLGGDGARPAGRDDRSRRHVLQPAHPSQRHRLQHQAGRAGRRAQGLHGPAGSEVRGQAGQGPSRLLRHDHDGDAADRARAGLAYFEKLAKQKVLQVQSATEPPKRLEAGERAVAVDGSDYLFWLAKERGLPIEVVLAVEGTPQISNPMGIFKSAPNPNAARLLVSWIMSAEGQSFIVNLSGQYAANRQVKPKAGRPVLAQVKTFKEDPAAVEKQADQIKAQYAQVLQGMTPRALRRLARRCSLWRSSSAGGHDRAADGLADGLRLRRQGRPGHARQLRHAVHRSELLRSADHHADHLGLGERDLLPRSPRRWAGWWRAPTCRCRAPCAPW